ncbi:hypothetical protein KNT87_gp078 [Erwinia phage Cronus]|uniref:Uncharacterized protein n=1 Tax=Erwinia phage Cronus TaxID=2163633 RepID=A0A2S1GM99_9CAUD|nr:hypothetical protein KNT87_gp078 [Erwinia phage Cronus]AWD90517.1 hypothetical protein [Erwinia phage Cronus]
MLNGTDVFVRKCMQYPPQQIFGGVATTITKIEKRTIDICEELYRYNKLSEKDVRYLAEMNSAYRELEVAIKMNAVFASQVKSEYMLKVLVAFMKSADEAITRMNRVFKQEQGLWNYYQQFAVTPKVIRESLVEYALANYGVELVKTFKEELARKS